MVNKVTLIGNLGSDPEVRRLESGAVVAKFSLATNENYRDKAGEWQTQTEWHNVVVWRHMAERAEKYLKKGHMLYVEGKLTHRKYEDPNGQVKYFTEVVGNYMRSLTKREDTPGSFPTSEPGTTSAPSNNATAPAAPTSKPAAPVADTAPAADDDLPF